MFSQENAVLLIVDVQGKLARLMYKKDELIRHIGGLIHVADFLEIPIIFTEQAPHKIGTTIPEVSKFLKGRKPVPKVTFSCCAEEKFMQALEALGRKQIIVTGIEAHVCIYQTVRDLMDRQYEVQVVGDAVSSRTLENREIGFKLMNRTGAILTSTE